MIKEADRMRDSRKRMIKRAVKEIKDGMNVNLGIGMPTLVANEIPNDYNVLLQSENGLLGIVSGGRNGGPRSDQCGKRNHYRGKGSLVF